MLFSVVHFFQAVSVTIAVISQGISCAPQRPEQEK